MEREAIPVSSTRLISSRKGGGESLATMVAPPWQKTRYFCLVISDSHLILIEGSFFLFHFLYPLLFLVFFFSWVYNRKIRLLPFSRCSVFFSSFRLRWNIISHSFLLSECNLNISRLGTVSCHTNWAFILFLLSFVFSVELINCDLKVERIKKAFVTGRQK